MRTFGVWCQDEQIAERLLPLHIGAAFEVIVSRIASLGYSPAQRRIVHRLLSGSASGWPGLLMLFATRASLTTTHRRYVLRQIRYFCARPDVSSAQ